MLAANSESLKAMEANTSNEEEKTPPKYFRN